MKLATLRKFFRHRGKAKLYLINGKYPNGFLIAGFALAFVLFLGRFTAGSWVRERGRLGN